MYGCMDVWMYGCMDVWMHGCMDAWMHGCMDAWMYGCMDVWMYGCTDVWMCGPTCSAPPSQTSSAWLSLLRGTEMVTTSCAEHTRPFSFSYLQLLYFQNLPFVRASAKIRRFVVLPIFVLMPRFQGLHFEQQKLKTAFKTSRDHLLIEYSSRLSIEHSGISSRRTAVAPRNKNPDAWLADLSSERPRVGYTYIYIYIYREREGDVYIYIYTHIYTHTLYIYI